MTQEDKQLLLSDILGRLQYGVKAHYKYYDFIGGTEQLVSEDDAIITGVNTTLGNPIQVDGYYVEVEYVKPYLRPMSDMSEDERKYITDKCGFTTMGPIGGDFGLVMPVIATEWLVDFYNSHHIDWRGLIPMGLALEAKEGMYNNNVK